jgi:hypothetical protein
MLLAINPIDYYVNDLIGSTFDSMLGRIIEDIHCTYNGNIRFIFTQIFHVFPKYIIYFIKSF